MYRCPKCGEFHTHTQPTHTTDGFPVPEARAAGPMPLDAPERMRAQAEMVDLRHAALCLLQEHGRQHYPGRCHCSGCQSASRWVPTPKLGPEEWASQACRR